MNAPLGQRWLNPALSLFNSQGTAMQQMHRENEFAPRYGASKPNKLIVAIAQRKTNMDIHRKTVRAIDTQSIN